MNEESDSPSMRRHDKEIGSRQEIDAIMRSALVCRIAFSNGDEPYVVPVSFGYDGEALFIHTATSGRKIEFMEANSRVCFELEENVSLRADDRDACKWTFAFESIIGYGTITELETAEDRARGLNQIMLHYSGREWEIDKAATATTRVWRIDIESVTGKRSMEKPIA
jgi:nitroimidazol reductase NimA-like FMN-containing flavoprotein (pyridoxamine 5'-phosphate oxidase superfamily)